jgi:integrase/recombinase XerC
MTTGLRRGELAALEVHDILPVPARPESLAVRGKGRREKEPVTLPELARSSLAEYLIDRGYTAGPLFYGRSLGAERPQGSRDRPPISGETIRRITRRLAAAAGLPPIRPHGLRHSGATLLLEAGHDVRQVRRWTRHKTLDMVLRYDDERHDVAGELSQDLAARLTTLSHIARVENVNQAPEDRDHPSKTGD